MSLVVSIEGRSQRTHRLCIHQKCVTLTQTSTVELATYQNRRYMYTNVTPKGTVEMVINKNDRYNKCRKIVIKCCLLSLHCLS
jgi:hypothetical protein